MRKLLFYSGLMLYVTNSIAHEPITKIKILDGDTIEITQNNAVKKILRLSNIDAPEAPQESGFRSARNLKKILGDTPKIVKYHVDFIDHFGRENATIFVNNTNVNLQQVKDGYAWTIKNLGTKKLQESQRNAKKFGRGLWSISQPSPPWLFRSNLNNDRPNS